jgi:hypothetical protein
MWDEARLQLTSVVAQTRSLSRAASIALGVGANVPWSVSGRRVGRNSLSTDVDKLVYNLRLPDGDESPFCAESAVGTGG